MKGSLNYNPRGPQGSQKISSETIKFFKSFVNFPSVLARVMKSEASKSIVLKKKFNYYSIEADELNAFMNHEKMEELYAKIRRNIILSEKQIKALEGMLKKGEKKIVKMELENKKLEKIKNYSPLYASKANEMIKGIRTSIEKSEVIIGDLENEINDSKQVLHSFQQLAKKTKKI